MSINRIIIIVIAVWSAVSCGNRTAKTVGTDQSADVKSTVNTELTGMTIDLPLEKLHAVKDGKVISVEEWKAYYQEKEYSIIIYFGTGGCTVCEMKACHLWDDFIDEIDSDNVNYYFVSRPEDGTPLNVLAAVVNESYFSLPVFVDTENAFMDANNDLPAIDTHTSFLLDKDGRVLFSGDAWENIATIKMLVRK